MLEKVFCNSASEAEEFVKEGFAIVAISFFPGEGASFTLERGSEWSRFLGGR